MQATMEAMNEECQVTSYLSYLSRSCCSFGTHKTTDRTYLRHSLSTLCTKQFACALLLGTDVASCHVHSLHYIVPQMDFPRLRYNRVKIRDHAT